MNDPSATNPAYAFAHRHDDSTTVDEARAAHCAGCQGWYVTADPEPTGEPGDPYQVQCPGIRVESALDVERLTEIMAHSHIYDEGLADILAIEGEARTAALDEARAAVDDIPTPTRYVNDANGNWFTTDMAYGWECAVEAALAAIDALREGADKT